MFETGRVETDQGAGYTQGYLIPGTRYHVTAL